MYLAARLLATASLSRSRHAVPLGRRAALFCSAPPPLPPPPAQLYLECTHPATLPVDELRKECDVKNTKGSGPGGQRRNKVMTAVVVKHRPTEVTAQASEARSQAANLSQAMFRLRVRLALECRSASVPAAPSARWASRVSGGKLGVNAAHADFPAILSEALDFIWDRRDVKAASEALGVTPSQVTKLLTKEPAALQHVNALRRASGLGPLRAT